MIFEQLFDTKSSTYTYILSSGKGREALIIDPVLEHTDQYINLLNKLELKLVKVIDTHIHADHITGLNELSERTSCTKIMGENSKSEVVDLRVKEDENVKIDNINFLYGGSVNSQNFFEIRDKCKVDLQRRPEQLTIDEFLDISNNIIS